MNDARQQIEKIIKRLPTNEQKIEALIDILKEGDGFFKEISLRELRRLKAKNAEKEVLRTLWTTKDPFVRTAAIRTLGGLGVKSEKVITTLHRAKISDDSYDRDAALEALSRLGEATPEQIKETRDMLLKRISHPIDYIRVDAIESLGDLPPSDETIEKLISLARSDPLGAIRDESLQTLGKLGAPQAMSLMFRYFKGKHPYGPAATIGYDLVASAHALIYLHRASPQSLPLEKLMEEFLKVFKNDRWLVLDPLFVEFVAEHQSVDALFRIFEITESRSHFLRLQALIALTSFTHMKSYLPAIRQKIAAMAVQDEEQNIRELASQILKDIDLKSGPSIPLQEKSLLDQI